MKNIKSIKEATIITIIALIVNWLGCPLAAFVGFFYRRGGSNIPYGYNWHDILLTSFIFTVVILLFFITFVIIEVKRRFFQVELYTISKISYDDFISEFKKCNNTYVFKYLQYVVILKADNEFTYAILDDLETIKKESFLTLEELLSHKIISGETLDTLWNELEYVCCDSIVRNNLLP